MNINESNNIKKCIGKERDLVNTYDQYVDVVSSWEAFLENSYNEKYEKFFFDRFPSIPIAHDRPLTPDFTSFFTEEYGIVCEISRTFPRSSKGLEKEMRQLFKYDGNISIFNGKKHINVDNYDIILLLGAKDSHVISKRIKEYLQRENKKFNHNFIVMEYISNYMDRHPSYLFRKVPIIESNFTDFFPEDISLHNKIDKNMESIQVKVDIMKEYKINGVLCNDKPPFAYLAGYIWHKIFFGYLEEEQKKSWREKNPNLKISINVEINDLKSRVEKSIKNGRIIKEWIRNVVEFLVECDLAEKKSNDLYEIKYRNLCPILKINFEDKFFLEKEYKKELSNFFIERYCKKEFIMHKNLLKQEKLDDLDILR